jgi:oxygen-dependent protoporphyrinogen oxidase
MCTSDRGVTPELQSEVVVIGGGIAGLAAAYELSVRGVSFTLLEASDRLGGLIRTEHVGGYTVDSGADSMLAQKPAAIALCEELGLAGRLMASTPPRTAYVYARDRLHQLPSPSVFGIPTTEEGLASYDLLSESARTELATLAAQSTQAGGHDESVADFFRRQFGNETVELIAEPLLGGIHAGDVEQLSMESVAPRLAAAARSGSLVGTFRTASASTDPEGMFRALRAGMGELVDSIAERLPRDAVRLESPAIDITRRGSTFQILTPGTAVQSRAVIVAAPAHAAASMLADLDPMIAALCADVPYVSTVSVALAWPRSQVGHPLQGSGFVVARRHCSLRITACTWVSSKWAERAPGDMVLLRAFLGSAHDPDASSLPDDALIKIAVRDLGAVLGISTTPHLTRVQRWVRAGAQHNVGHRAKLVEIDRRLTNIPGLFVAGSGFRSIGIPDCVADGRASATAAADYVKIQE